MEKKREQYLSWEQEFAILNELEQRQNQKLQCILKEIGELEMRKFNLRKNPHRNTISKIKKEKI